MSDKIKIFVCTKGKKCPKRGSENVCTAFELAVSELGCHKTVSIKGSKCLDLCKNGPVVVTMPDKVSYGRVRPADAKEIVANLVAAGKPVARLRVQRKD